MTHKNWAKEQTSRMHPTAKSHLPPRATLFFLFFNHSLVVIMPLFLKNHLKIKWKSKATNVTHIVITRLGRAIFTTHITFPRDPVLQGVMFCAVLDQNRIPSDRLGEEPQGGFLIIITIIAIIAIIITTETSLPCEFCHGSFKYFSVTLQ